MNQHAHALCATQAPSQPLSPAVQPPQPAPRDLNVGQDPTAFPAALYTMMELSGVGESELHDYLVLKTFLTPDQTLHNLPETFVAKMLRDENWERITATIREMRPPQTTPKAPRTRKESAPMSEKINGAALDWDSPIENDGKSFHLFPDGSEVHFEVMELARATSKNLNCPMAKVKLRVFDIGKPGLESVILENLVLHTSCEWKICEFFTAIGQRKHGQKLMPRWSDVVGSGGRCRLSVETFKKRDNSEAQTNRVKSFLEPVDSGVEPTF